MRTVKDESGIEIPTDKTIVESLIYECKVQIAKSRIQERLHNRLALEGKHTKQNEQFAALAKAEMNRQTEMLNHLLDFHREEVDKEKATGEDKDKKSS